MSEKNEKALDSLTEGLEQICRETTEAFERATKAQAEFLGKGTEVTIRGYVGVLNGTVGAMMHAYVGFLDGFSRAWKRNPNNPPSDGGQGRIQHGTGGRRKVSMAPGAQNSSASDRTSGRRQAKINRKRS